jgi:hypothetical protein
MSVEGNMSERRRSSARQVVGATERWARFERPAPQARRASFKRRSEPTKQNDVRPLHDQQQAPSLVSPPSGPQRDRPIVDNEQLLTGQQLIIRAYERKFQVLAQLFGRFMNFYGLAEDVSLLLVDTNFNQEEEEQQQQQERENDWLNGSGSEEANRHDSLLGRQQRAAVGGGEAKGLQASDDGPAALADRGQPTTVTTRPGLQDGLARACWLAMIALANLFTVYMLVAHFVWELLRLDAKMSTYSPTGSTGATKNVPEPPTNAASAANGWSVLKDFIENTRRHLSRFFALVLIFIWHKNCHKIELLFVDCRRYYAAFYPKLRPLQAKVNRSHWAAHEHRHRAEAELALARRSLSSLGLEQREQPKRFTFGGQFGHLLERSVSAGRPSLPDWREFEREHQLRFIEASSKFYALAWKRIAIGVCFPFAHLALNVIGVLVSPRALIIANNGQEPQTPASPALSSTSAAAASSWPLWMSFYSDRVASTGGTAEGLASQLMDNFRLFHRAVHTAFHPFDHQLGSEQPQQQQQQSTQTHHETQISDTWSAVFSLTELAVHSIYINGPRIVCATCLSLIFSIHHQCLHAFNEHLIRLIRRPHDQPLVRSDMVKLLKQYDMIGMMHERIERTFKWSLISWFSLTFIGCLLLIYTLTESTSAALIGVSLSQPSASPGQSSSVGPAAAAAAAAGQTLVSPMNASTTACLVMIILARILFVCYSTLLIYAEAFKIESENSRASQLLMLLSRRQDDPVAQSLEPALFEPIQLSVGGYFSLGKRSVAPLLGAIVTFSIMFMGECLRADRAEAMVRRRARRARGRRLLEAFLGVCLQSVPVRTAAGPTMPTGRSATLPVQTSKLVNRLKKLPPNINPNSSTGLLAQSSGRNRA